MLNSIGKHIANCTLLRRVSYCSSSIRSCKAMAAVHSIVTENEEKSKQPAFNVKEFINGLNKDYKIDIHKLSGFPFNESHKNMNQKHYVICIHNFLSDKDATFYQKNTRKLCEKDLLKHGNRRHALYFNVDNGLNKQIYRYGNHDWKMNNGIPDLIQNTLLTKLQKEFGMSFNGIVYNVYTSKKSHIWWHTDLQPGVADIIATFSTGRTEYLEFRAMHKPVVRNEHFAERKDEVNLENESENECVLSVPCHHGTLAIMCPGVNQFYQHRVSVPTETQLNEAVAKFGCIDRENTTMHFHFDEVKYNNSFLNLDPNGGLSTILKHLP
eukprot:616790_1